MKQLPSYGFYQFRQGNLRNCLRIIELYFLKDLQNQF